MSKCMQIVLLSALLSANATALKHDKNFMSGCYYVLHVAAAEHDGPTTRYKTIASYESPVLSGLESHAQAAVELGHVFFVARVCTSEPSQGI